MDDALKARLIGAAILVALAVLLIPELLSGRKSAEPTAAQSTDGGRGTRTFTIELGGTPQGSMQVGPAPSTASAPAARPEPAAEPATVPTDVRTADAGVGAAAAPPVPGPAPPPAEAKVDATEAPVEAPPPARPPSTPVHGGWVVQVGAFGSAATANRLVQELSDAGYQVFVSPLVKGGKTLHRVRVGPEPDRGSAASLVAGLQARGLPATVVAND